MVYIVSPHIDDACFSLGLTMEMHNSLGHQIDVINCFTISDFTIEKNCSDVEEVTRIRKTEDRKLASMLEGLRFKNLDLLDAPLRKDLIKQKLPLTRDNQVLVHKIVSSIRDIVPVGSNLYCPISIGNHIDHLICMEAAITISRSKSYFISFYEDLPYASRCTAEEISDKLSYIQHCTKMQLLLNLNTFDNCTKKEQLIQCYTSQLDARISEEIIYYTSTHCGERVWRLSISDS